MTSAARSVPPIAKAAFRVRVMIEGAVSRFARSHRYLSGSDLRVSAKAEVMAVRGAWRDPEQRLLRVRELAAAVDDLKEQLQLCQGVRSGTWATWRYAKSKGRDTRILGR